MEAACQAVRTAFFAAVLGATAASTVHADAIPMPGSTDDRVRTAVYQRDQVYRLTGRVGYQLDLEFASDERFVGLAAGDVEALSFEAQSNHLFLKPKAARVATNLTVLTTRRHYHLDYTVQSPRVTVEGAEFAPPIYALRFTYPEDEAARARVLATTTAATSQEAFLSTALATLTPVVNRHYAYCGPRAIKPTEVSDDGVHTRFTFGARTELPAIFTRAADGTESLVNFTVTADGLTVHRIAARFILRRGRLVGCVVNQAFDGAGERLSTGTISPGVERTMPKTPDTPEYHP
jgi:type IV secretion system protein VirB9